MFGLVKKIYSDLFSPYSCRNPIRRILAGHGFELSSSVRKWARLRNKFKGRIGFVIGNGPSLLISDLDRLKEVISIGSNKIYLAYHETAFRPTIWTCVDQIVAENMARELALVPGEKFFSHRLKPIVGHLTDTYFWLEVSGNNPDGSRSFSTDASCSICSGHTITYNNLQIAYHLGLSTVYLIGCDFNFMLPQKRQRHEYGEALVSEGERNHFVNDYRKPGEIWTAPDLERQKNAFESAKLKFEVSGRKIYNATRGGKLEVFERRSLDDIFKGLSI